MEFSTYATPTIVGEIKRHFRDRGWTIRVPRRLQEMRLSITRPSPTLSQELGRSPTVAELAKRIGVTRGGDPRGSGVGERLQPAVPGRPGPRRRGSARSSSSSATTTTRSTRSWTARRSSRCWTRSTPGAKRILLLRFFRNMTQSQIAEELGISQMHVSRLLTPHPGRPARTARGPATPTSPPTASRRVSLVVALRAPPATAGGRRRPARPGRARPARPRHVRSSPPQKLSPTRT